MSSFFNYNFLILCGLGAVSYTHLDVYKRQTYRLPFPLIRTYVYVFNFRNQFNVLSVCKRNIFSIKYFTYLTRLFPNIKVPEYLMKSWSLFTYVDKSKFEPSSVQTNINYKAVKKYCGKIGLPYLQIKVCLLSSLRTRRLYGKSIFIGKQLWKVWSVDNNNCERTVFVS